MCFLSRPECQRKHHFPLTAPYFKKYNFIKNVVSGSLENKINVHESPVSQAGQLVLGAQGPLLFLCPLALRLAHAHQAPPDSVTEPEKERQATKKNRVRQLNYNSFHITNRERSTGQTTCGAQEITKGFKGKLLFPFPLLEFISNSIYCEIRESVYLMYNSNI